MIETRFALPQRSPKPFIVPCTRSRPPRTAASELATPHSASLWQWMPTGDVAERGDDRRGGLADLRAGSDAPFVSHSVTHAAPASAAARSAAQRVVGVVAVAVEEVLGVVDDPSCPRRTRNATESAIMRRFSSRSTRTTFSRCSSHVLPTSVQTGAKRAGEQLQRRVVLVGAHVAPPRHAEGGDLAPWRSVSRASSSKSSASLGFEAGKPASISGTPSSSSSMRDADLLAGRERHALALHPVAQGAVVDEMTRLTVARAGAGETSSHSA